MRIIFYVIGGVTLFFFLGAIGCKSLIGHIYNRVDCEQFNIDNVEVRTGINIPAVTDVECQCDEAKTIKTNTFILNSDLVDMNDYVSKNKFQLEDGQYKNIGKREDTEWEAILNTETSELKVVIKYRM